MISTIQHRARTPENRRVFRPRLDRTCTLTPTAEPSRTSNLCTFVHHPTAGPSSRLNTNRFLQKLGALRPALAYASAPRNHYQHATFLSRIPLQFQLSITQQRDVYSLRA
jgi:hypothetical protein